MDFAAKRQAPRFTRCEAVRIKTPGGVEYATYEDISAVGLKLRSDRRLDLGSLLELEFDAPTSFRSDAPDLTQSIRCLARVIHCSRLKNLKSYTVGVQFIDSLHLKQKALIQRWIDSEEGPF